MLADLGCPYQRDASVNAAHLTSIGIGAPFIQSDSLACA